MEKLNKLSLPATILIASIVLGGFYYASQVSRQNSIEKQQQIELQAKRDQNNVEVLEAQQKQAQTDLIKHQEQLKADLLQQQKAKEDNFINKCITDAYTELKTLQWNYGVISAKFCTNGNCDTEYWNKAKDEAFTTYKEEWIPQCKLGNRVFIHYESMSY